MTHIGISGPIAAGKSTLGRMLHDSLVLKTGSMDVCIIPFASGLKELGALHTRNPSDAYHLARTFFTTLGYKDKADIAAEMLLDAFERFPVKENEKPRRLYQYIGGEIGRDTVAKDVWIKDVQRRAKNCEFVISDDLRHINESEAVDIHIAIRVETDEEKALYAERIKTLSPEFLYSDHPSEQERAYLKQPTYTIPIGFTQQDIDQLVARILEDLFLEWYLG